MKFIGIIFLLLGVIDMSSTAKNPAVFALKKNAQVLMEPPRCIKIKADMTIKRFRCGLGK